MQQIGKNNLGFRLPLGRHEDEFFRIASRFNRMCDELEDTINKNYIYQLLQKNAAYEALQASVNPHFLYNSLEAIREMLDGAGQEEGAEMVLLLSHIFKYQIRGRNLYLRAHFFRFLFPPFHPPACIRAYFKMYGGIFRASTPPGARKPVPLPIFPQGC